LRVGILGKSGQQPTVAGMPSAPTTAAKSQRNGNKQIGKRVSGACPQMRGRDGCRMQPVGAMHIAGGDKHLTRDSCLNEL